MIEFFQGAFFPELSHFLLQQWATYLAQFVMWCILVITDIKVNEGQKSAIFKLDQVDIFPWNHKFCFIVHAMV